MISASPVCWFMHSTSITIITFAGGMWSFVVGLLPGLRIHLPPSRMWLSSLRRWLVSYDDLFSRPCTATGALLAADAASGHFFPPLLRPYGPALQRPALIAGAQGGPRAAYHPHAAPADMHRL